MLRAVPSTSSLRASELPVRVYRRFLFDFLPIFLLTFGSMLVAIQIRLRLTAGRPLGDDYTPMPWLMVAIIVLTALGAAALSITLRRLLHRAKSRWLLFFAFLVAAGVSAGATLLFLPDISQLQVAYFAATAVLLGAFTILLPPTIYVYGRETTIFQHLARLWENRVLLRIMTYYGILSRYSQTKLGMLWIVILPLSTALILTFVFSQVFRPIDIGDVPFISFFLIGLTFWSFFNQSITQGSVSLLQRMGLIGQVYFPRELVVLVKLGESMVDLLFTYLIMLAINAISGIYPNINHLYIPVLLVIQITFTVGVMLFVSYLSVLIRDIPNLVGVVMQFLFYFTPILYTVDLIPEHLRFIVLFNPIAVLIDGYRSIILYNRPLDLVSLFYPAVVAVAVAYVGYCFFKKNERIVADYV